MWLTRRKFVVLAAAATGPAMAGVPTVDLLALRGFDAVSYHLPNGPKAGRAEHEVSWRGRVWRFLGPANREIFRRDPEAYAPRLGGFDPVGVAEGRLVETDPLVFAVAAGRLYLFRDAGRRERAAVEAALLGEAEARWPGLNGLTDGLPPG